MPDTIYGWLPCIPLLVALFFVWNRGSANKLVYVGLLLYYPAFLIAQDVTGTNSPAVVNFALCVALAVFTAFIAGASKTRWPLGVSALLLMSAGTDIIHYGFIAQSGDARYNRLYQDIGAGLFWLCCFWLAYHSRGRRHERQGRA